MVLVELFNRTISFTADHVAHVSKVACRRPQETAVSWVRTPAVRVTVEHSAAGLPIPEEYQDSLKLFTFYLFRMNKK